MVFHGIGNTRIGKKHVTALADYLEKNPDVSLEHLPVRLGEAVPFSVPTLKKAMHAYSAEYPVFAKYLQDIHSRGFSPKPKLTPEMMEEIRKQFKQNPTPENFRLICKENAQYPLKALLECVVEDVGTKNDQMRIRTALKYSVKQSQSNGQK